MDSHRKSFFKAVSWRLIGSLGTFAIALFLTGSTSTSAAIGLGEFVLKIGLFYVHERLWSRFT